MCSSDLEYVAALLAGGLIAAPIAAYLVRHLNPRLLGVIVGGFICFTNARVLLSAAGVSGDLFLATYVVLIAVWSASIAAVVIALKREPAAAR